MQGYILRRLLYAIPTVIGVSLIIFLAMRVVPGDPVVVMFGDEPELIRAEDRAKIEADLGLSDPLVVQYGKWMKDIGTGKLGVSFWRGDTVADLIKRRGPLTIEIAVLAIILAWVIGVPVGILSALHQNSVADYLARFFTVLFLAIPSFWLASLAVLVLVLVWGWGAPLGVIDVWEDPIQNLQIVLRPAIVLGLAVSAYIARMTRSSLLEVIREDYIRTARAKGLRERMVVWRHALRNTMLPVITLSGVLFGFMLGGSVVLEQAFNVPGLGRAMVEAFVDVDYIVIQNLVLLYGVVFVVINLLIDISYAWLDPRIRYG
ncbi:Putative peptide transport system permease protein BAB2_1050 [Geodia barretti]|uniref:Peptide transport system permease protein BAB2_1050 n=1 Tax=Geodia barretti TaxID=519541 RepID=A0AA35RUW8_GEOBA|nr:Putative peptide transport system permease protein BAB2_1050 [Geodia barretti]